MATPNLLQNYNAAVQADMRNKIVQLKQQNAPTSATLKSGAGRRESGTMVGLEIPYKRGVFHGEVALNPYVGQNSFEPMIAPQTDKMFVGLAFSGFTVESEWFHERDKKMPENEGDYKTQVMTTYAQHQNWYHIGRGDGSLAIITVGGGSGLITLAFDQTAFGRSKGSIRLAPSWSNVSGKRVEYESWTKATDTKTATFYITDKPSAVTATIVVTDGGITVAGDIIVKKGHYKKVTYGFGYHMQYTGRLYQGADTSVDTFLNSRRVNGLGGPITPTLIDTAKGATQIRANDANARHNRIFRMTIGHYKNLSGFGYTLRHYNAEGGQANTTYGLPYVYKDEDSLFIQDADYEEGEIHVHDRTSYFIYQQSELAEVTERREQYPGLNLVGSTEMFRNWGVANNLAWDARGDDGKLKGNGAPNSSIVIDNLAIPALNQVDEGQSLV